MKIGIITDSHDHHKNVLRAVEIFTQRQVDTILHAGDIVSPFTAKAFGQVPGAKFIAVYGNNDGEKLNLRSLIAGFGGEIHDVCYKGELAGKKVFMTHTQHTIEEIAKSQDYDLVVYGHTHKQDLRQMGRTLIINPGESTDWLTGRGQVVILNLPGMDYETMVLE